MGGPDFLSVMLAFSSTSLSKFKVLGFPTPTSSRTTAPTTDTNNPPSMFPDNSIHSDPFVQVITQPSESSPSSLPTTASTAQFSFVYPSRPYYYYSSLLPSSPTVNLAPHYPFFLPPSSLCCFHFYKP